MPYDDGYSIKQNPAWNVGQFISGVTDGAKPMGSWTGLDPLAGAPISGAIWGAGLGSLYGGIKDLTDDQNDPETRRKLFLKRLRNGTLAGLGTGVLSGYLQKRGSFDQDSVVTVIMRDNSITYDRRSQILDALRAADVMTWQRLAGMAATGMLTAKVAASVLGLGSFGAAVMGGLGAFVANNYFHGPRVFV